MKFGDTFEGVNMFHTQRTGRGDEMPVPSRY